MKSFERCCRLKSFWLNCCNGGSKDKQTVFRQWWVKNLDLSLQLLQTFIILMYWASIREKSFSKRWEASVFNCMVQSELVFSGSEIFTFKRPIAFALYYLFEKMQYCIFHLPSSLGSQNPFRVYCLLCSPRSFLSCCLSHWLFCGMLFFSDVFGK